MDEFEQQLRKALARQDPPAWFEAKVLAAAAARRPEPARWWQRWFAPSRLRWATATLAVTLVTGIAWQRERMAGERAAGEAARVQLELALRITSQKLQIIEQKIQQNN